MNKQPGASPLQKPGLLGTVKEGDFPQELITAESDYRKALGKAVLFSQNERNNIILYRSQLAEFGMTEEQNDLTDFLNASCAIGGFNRSLAAQAHVGMFFPEAAGIKLSNDQRKALVTMNESVQNRREREGNQRQEMGEN